MKINVEKSVKEFPTFGELKCGDVFIPVRESCVYLKAKYEANGKVKAVRLADGFITDIQDCLRVTLCDGAELNVKI